jgi:hypothetical protein
MFRSVHFVLQPMNFHLNEGLMVENSIIHKPDSPPSRRVVFDILNLSSALFLHEGIRVSAVDENHLEGKARLVYQTVSKLSQEVAAAGHQILLKLRTPAPTPGLVSLRPRVKSTTIMHCLDFCKFGIAASIIQSLPLESFKFHLLRFLVLVRCFKMVSSVP